MLYFIVANIISAFELVSFLEIVLMAIFAVLTFLMYYWFFLFLRLLVSALKAGTTVDTSFKGSAETQNKKST